MDTSLVHIQEKCMVHIYNHLSYLKYQQNLCKTMLLASHTNFALECLLLVNYQKTYIKLNQYILKFNSNKMYCTFNVKYSKASTIFV